MLETALFVISPFVDRAFGLACLTFYPFCAGMLVGIKAFGCTEESPHAD